jgi:hypothetical protein
MAIPSTNATADHQMLISGRGKRWPFSESDISWVPATNSNTFTGTPSELPVHGISGV